MLRGNYRRGAAAVFWAAFFFYTFSAYAESLNDWAKRVEPVALKKLLANVSPSGMVAGTVIASPSHEYYFHWVRDASIVLDELRKSDPKTAVSILGDFAKLSREQQKLQTRSGARGLGEPKFNVDGSAFTGDWGRPQDDGPALRAIVLIEEAKRRWMSGDLAGAKELYDGKIPTESVVKADLEYISHHWNQTSFDLWEEVRGFHFFTRMVQRKALVRGAELARLMGDRGAADWYSKQAGLLKKEILKHWIPRKGYLVATLGRDGGADYKYSGLDSAVVLGVLLGSVGDGFMGVSDSRVRATVKALERKFRGIYTINKRAGIPGVAIGRYPEDKYFGGNPWVLTTLAFAEYYYRLGAAARGDEFLERVKTHVYADGSMSEQMDRSTGFMSSMADLTWNYAAFLSAVRLR